MTALVRSRWIVPALASALLLGDGSDVGAQAAYGESRQRFFPDSGFFRPLVAHMKEPTFYAGFRSVEFDGSDEPSGGQETITAAVVAIGGTFRIWETRRGGGDDDGFGGELFAATFSQFNLDVSSADLINTDFIVGLAVTGRRGRWSTRLRGYHQSSHLGDELLLNNPDIERESVSFEVVDGLLAADVSFAGIRASPYGGGGYIVATDSELDRGLAQWGLEVRGPSLAGGERSVLFPVLASDFQSFEEQGWDATSSLKGGLEWTSRGGSRGVRLLVVYLEGFMPFGQFFNDTRLNNIGGELQLRFRAGEMTLTELRLKSLSFRVTRKSTSAFSAQAA